MAGDAAAPLIVDNIEAPPVRLAICSHGLTHRKYHSRLKRASSFLPNSKPLTCHAKD